MRKQEYIVESIKATAQEIMPANAKVILFGSQARGDAHEDSDWDLLILLDKTRIKNEDFDIVAYPFVELGWKIDVKINPLLYTYQDWQKRHFTPFYKNVNQDGVLLWH